MLVSVLNAGVYTSVYALISSIADEKLLSTSSGFTQLELSSASQSASHRPRAQRLKKKKIIMKKAAFQWLIHIPPSFRVTDICIQSRAKSIKSYWLRSLGKELMSGQVCTWGRMHCSMWLMLQVKRVMRWFWRWPLESFAM